MKASDIIELVGGEIKWELLNADGKWFVWASHHGDGEDKSFKFCESGESLAYAVRRVANEVLDWQKPHKNSIPQCDTEY